MWNAHTAFLLCGTDLMENQKSNITTLSFLLFVSSAVSAILTVTYEWQGKEQNSVGNTDILLRRFSSTSHLLIYFILQAEDFLWHIEPSEDIPISVLSRCSPHIDLLKSSSSLIQKFDNFYIYHILVVKKSDFILNYNTAQLV